MPGNFWDDWEYPWTLGQARTRYVQGPRISQRELIEDSGIPRGTLERHSSKGGWIEARRVFKGEERARTEEKTLEKIAEIESDNYAKRHKEHLEAWESLRQVSTRLLDYVRVTVRAKERGEALPAGVVEARDYLLDLGGKAPLACYMNGLRMAITGERELEFMQYADPNTLNKYARLQGFALVDPLSGKIVESENEAIPAVDIDAQSSRVADEV